MDDTLVCSYNVRYAGDDHHDIWPERRDSVVALLRYHAPAIVGLQEPTPGQYEDLDDRLDVYTFRGTARNAAGTVTDRTETGEAVPIAFRSDRFEQIDGATFHLSETPAEPGAGWDANYPRVTTWLRLRDREADRTLVVCNTHFDHQGRTARRESARLLRERLPAIAGDDPIVLLGDLNSTPGSEPYAILTERFADAADLADVRHGPRTSVTDFTTLVHSRRIDHVLVSGDVDVRAFATLADRDERGRYPSDHLPVAARLRY